MRRVFGVAMLVLLPSLAGAQGEPPSKSEFCREALDMAGDLLTQSATVLVATGLEGLEETGEAVAADPRVEESVTTLADTSVGIAKVLTDYCRS